MTTRGVGLSEEEREALLRRANDACRPCGPCDSGLPMECACDPEPRAVIASLLDLYDDVAARTADLAAQVARVTKVVNDLRRHEDVAVMAEWLAVLDAALSPAQPDTEGA